MSVLFQVLCSLYILRPLLLEISFLSNVMKHFYGPICIFVIICIETSTFANKPGNSRSSRGVFFNKMHSNNEMAYLV